MGVLTRTEPESTKGDLSPRIILTDPIPGRSSANMGIHIIKWEWKGDLCRRRKKKRKKKKKKEEEVEEIGMAYMRGRGKWRLTLRSGTEETG